jgi:hypothetical protein
MERDMQLMGWIILLISVLYFTGHIIAAAIKHF